LREARNIDNDYELIGKLKDYCPLEDNFKLHRKRMDELEYYIEFKRWCRDKENEEKIESKWNRINNTLILLINTIKERVCKYGK